MCKDCIMILVHMEEHNGESYCLQNVKNDGIK